MHKLPVIVLVWVVVASTASAQRLNVDLHGELLPKKIDRVTVSLTGFSADASSATVTMIGEHADPPRGVVEDGPLCRAIRPASVDVPLSNGEGSAVWNFSNRFDGRYRLRCLIRADDGMGNTADSRGGIHTFGGEHRMTLDPAQVAPNATTSVDVAVSIDSGYADGRKQKFVLGHWVNVPVVAGCDGVTPAQFNLERVQADGFQMLGTWDVMTTDPVECPVTFADPDFEGSATLSVVAATLDFAHFANGGLFNSDLVLLNAGFDPIRPAIYFYDQQGDPIATELVVDIGADLEIQDDGSLSVRTAMEPLGELTISTHGRGELVSGSVRVVSDRPVGGMLRFNLPNIGAAGVGASPAVQDALFPVRRQEGGINTGVAIHNQGEAAIVVRCHLMQAGVVLDEAVIPLAPRGQIAQFIDQSFPGSDTADFSGSVRCETPEPGRFSAMALEMDVGNRIFTTLPVVPVIQ